MIENIYSITLFQYIIFTEFRHYKCIQHNLKYTQEETANQYYAYVTRDDLVDCFGNDVILTVRNFNAYRSYRKSPDDKNDKLTHNLEIHSRTDPIDVRLVTPNGVTNIKQEPNQSINDSIISDSSFKINNNDDVNESKKNDESEDNSIAEQYSLRQKNRPTKRKYRLRYKTANSSDEEEEEKLFDDIKERKLIANILLRSKPAEKRCRRGFDCAQDIDDCKSNFVYFFVTNIYFNDFCFMCLANAPFLTLNPPFEYLYSLHKSEGICDLFYNFL